MSVRSIESIELKNCHGEPLEFIEAANETSKLEELQMLTIENCGLTELPAALIAKTAKLQSVSLNNNKIEFIAADQLKSVANSVSHCMIFLTQLSAFSWNILT
jgi:Leucine-rich repeat (LRR) protein